MKWRKILRKILLERIESVAILGNIMLISLFVILTKGLWLSQIPGILTLASQIGIITIGQALLIISGEFDLSVSSVFAFIGMIFVFLNQAGLGTLLSFLCGLLVASIIGLINGIITLKLKVPSLITTLGALFIYRGLVYFFTGGFPLRLPMSVKDDTLIYVLGGNFLSNFNNAIIYLIFITLMFVIILSYTKYGNHVVAVGGDPQTALSQGISPVKIKMIAFIICSLLAGLSGIITTSINGSVYASSGKGAELETIAAAVIGGCSLRGGIGSIWGTVLGVVMLLTIKNGLIIMGIDILWYLIILGLLLIGSILFKELLSAL